MRSLISRALRGLLGTAPGLVACDGAGALTVVTPAAGRAAIGACADDDPRLDAGGGGVPAGIIAAWSGAVANIPAGWALCNGSNGTPDLRGMFIKGATGEPGATGGSATHQHTYTDVPNHTHPVAIDDPGHAHVEQNNGTTTGPLTGWGARDTSTNSPGATGYSTLPATTGITATTSNPVGGVAQGTTAAASNEPLNYELAWVMKL